MLDGERPFIALARRRERGRGRRAINLAAPHRQEERSLRPWKETYGQARGGSAVRVLRRRGAITEVRPAASWR